MRSGQICFLSLPTSQDIALHTLHCTEKWCHLVITGHKCRPGATDLVIEFSVHFTLLSWDTIIIGFTRQLCWYTVCPPKYFLPLQALVKGLLTTTYLQLESLHRTGHSKNSSGTPKAASNWHKRPHSMSEPRAHAVAHRLSVPMHAVHEGQY